MKRVFFLLLFLLLSAAPVTVADTAEPPVRLRSVQADFIQEKHLKILARPLFSKGVFAFQAPQSLRWEYTSPVHSVLLMHEGRIRKMIEREGRFEQDNGAGVDAMQFVFQDLSSWLDGRFESNPMFTATRTDARTIVLTPKQQGLQVVINHIELHLGEREGVMERVIIVEGPEASTQLTFTNAVLNRDIPAETFARP